MKLFWFQRWKNFNFKELSLELESAGFDGILFPYSPYDDDHFISIAKNIDPQTNIKYMVAIRPYTISPQYINKLIQTINRISKNKVLINFVTGWIYDNEKTLGGVHGTINDMSSNIDRSNYLCDYIKTVNSMDSNAVDFYVSVTNQTVFEKIKDNKVIIPYVWYKHNRFDLSKTKAMISICPVIRKTKEELDGLINDSVSQDMEYFTEDEFILFLNKVNQDGIDGLLLFENALNTEKDNIVRLIKGATN